MRVISQESRSFTRSFHLFALVAMALFLFSAPRAGAQPTYNLASNNSSIVVNDNQQAAISSWIVDGVQQMSQLSNFYRVGPTGPERSTHTLPLINSFPTGPDSATVVWGNSQFTIEFDFGVTGGAPGSGYSRMGETVHITNNTSQFLEFHFFEYVDLDLSNTPNDDIGLPLNPNALEQFDGQTIVRSGTNLSYSHHEWAVFPNTLNHLTNAGPSLLNDQTPFGTPFGPNDVTWTLEWDFGGAGGTLPPIAPGATVTIEKYLECNFIPEPSSAMLGVMVLVAAMPARRRR